MNFETIEMRGNRKMARDVLVQWQRSATRRFGRDAETYTGQLVVARMSRWR